MLDRAHQYFWEVANSGSIRASSETLHVAASAISRQLAKLDDLYGASLFDRHAKGMSLSDAGKLVFRKVRDLRVEADQLHTEILSLKGIEKGSVRIVCGEGFVTDFMRHALVDFASRYPGITYTINNFGTDELVRTILENGADIGLIYNATVSPSLKVEFKRRCPIRLIAHPRRKLPRGPISLSSLGDIPCGMLPASFGTRQALAEAEMKAKVALTTRIETSSISVLRAFVREDLGITFLPEFSVIDDIAAGLLVSVALTDSALSKPEAQVVVSGERRQSFASRAILNCLSANMFAFGSGKSH
ncbi:MAG: hypothetical protein QOG67_995 [Verrucomicrobiota bacterium]|jgi:DNA-binding transcriptional LysR family regulator